MRVGSGLGVLVVRVDPGVVVVRVRPRIGVVVAVVTGGRRGGESWAAGSRRQSPSPGWRSCRPYSRIPHGVLEADLADIVARHREDAAPPVADADERDVIRPGQEQTAGAEPVFADDLRGLGVRIAHTLREQLEHASLHQDEHGDRKRDAQRAVPAHER